MHERFDFFTEHFHKKNSYYGFVIAGGGNVETIKFLIDRGADPNSQGQFLRTPLYRAAFAGHLEAVEVSVIFCD